MSKRKILILAMSLCMVAILAVGGSLAYFTDTDSKVNTFTVGDVNIHIDEWEENEEGEWVTYEDLQHLAPIAQSKAPFNKLVETVNDGSEDAYIRTFITCPAEDYWELGYGFNHGNGAKDLARPNVDGDYTMHYLDKWTDIGKTTVDGKEVYIFMCEHYEAIPAGDSILSMTKVWVYDTVKNADIGDGFEVKVFSEAIQSANLTYAEAMAALNGGKTDLEHAVDLFTGNHELTNN